MLHERNHGTTNDSAVTRDRARINAATDVVVVELVVTVVTVVVNVSGAVL